MTIHKANGTRPSNGAVSPVKPEAEHNTLGTGLSVQYPDMLRSARRRSMSRLLDAEKWDLVATSRIHVLVTGPTIVTRAFVEELEPRLSGRVIHVTCGAPLALSRLEGAATVVLHDIDKLALADQRQLLEWLDVIVGRTQVISTASRPLLPLVMTGRLLEALYYRLNTVYFKLGDADLTWEHPGGSDDGLANAARSGWFAHALLNMPWLKPSSIGHSCQRLARRFRSQQRIMDWKIRLELGSSSLVRGLG